MRERKHSVTEWEEQVLPGAPVAAGDFRPGSDACECSYWGVGGRIRPVSMLGQTGTPGMEDKWDPKQ